MLGPTEIQNSLTIPNWAAACVLSKCFISLCLRQLESAYDHERGHWHKQCFPGASTRRVCVHTLGRSMHTFGASRWREVRAAHNKTSVRAKNHRIFKTMLRHHTRVYTLDSNNVNCARHRRISQRWKKCESHPDCLVARNIEVNIVWRRFMKLLRETTTWWHSLFWW